MSVHTHFRIVCACGSRMHGETDGPIPVIQAIFVAGHDGPGHHIESVTGPRRAGLPTIAELQKRARAGLRSAAAV